uniref:VWFC domain-containing protein n=1 Tax=Branchiostoma floridae TaxID=7739 RepID=C3ZES8_BRAFL|eukprot:XP_002593223.1 hypothetical protein BRAFLDRAFT_120132 [Branchiostoma floridae]
MSAYVLLIAAACTLWCGAEGYAGLDPLYSQTTWYGIGTQRPRPVTWQYCMWEGHRMRVGSSWQVGCVEYSCRNDGFYYVRYGPEGNVRVVSTQYCEWEGKKMMIGSSWKTTGCEQCSCSEAGLFCAGSGRYLVPDHCLLLVDETCQTELVDANDPFSPCGMPQVFHGK